MNPWLRFVGDAEALLLTAQLVEFMAAYHLSTRGAWRRSDGGRHIMYFTGALAAVMILSAVRIIASDMLHALPQVTIHDPLWFQLLRMVVFLSVPVMVAQRRVMLWRAQREPAGDQ